MNVQKAGAAAKMWAGTSASGGNAPDWAREARESAVFGCYSAVQFADAVMLQRLGEQLPTLLKGRRLHRGAYKACVVCGLLGNASLSACMDLMDQYNVVSDNFY